MCVCVWCGCVGVRGGNLAWCVVCVVCVCTLGWPMERLRKKSTPGIPLGLGVASAIPLGPRMAPGQQNHQPRTVARLMKMPHCGTIKGCPRGSWDPLGGAWGPSPAATSRSTKPQEEGKPPSSAARCHTRSHACHTGKMASQLQATRAALPSSACKNCTKFYLNANNFLYPTGSQGLPRGFFANYNCWIN